MSALTPEDDGDPEVAHVETQVKVNGQSFGLSTLIVGEQPTELFWSLWKQNKRSVMEANLFVGKEDGEWVVKPGSPVYLVQKNGFTVPNGTHYTQEGAERFLDAYVGKKAMPTHWVSTALLKKVGFKDIAKAQAELEYRKKSEPWQDWRIETVAGSEVSGIAIRVEFKRPKFGTPEEREERRRQWNAFRIAAAEWRDKNAAELVSELKPSRWPLNYVAPAGEDVE